MKFKRGQTIFIVRRTGNYEYLDLGARIDEGIVRSGGDPNRSSTLVVSINRVLCHFVWIYSKDNVFATKEEAETALRATLNSIYSPSYQFILKDVLAKWELDLNKIGQSMISGIADEVKKRAVDFVHNYPCVCDEQPCPKGHGCGACEDIAEALGRHLEEK